MIELAILLPLLILLVFGITEYGRAMYQYDTLTKSARSAARFQSQYAPGADIGQARCLAVFGNRTCSGTPLIPGLSIDMVRACDASRCAGTHANQPTPSGTVSLVTITIHGYPFDSLVPTFMPDITFGDISVTMRQAL